MRFSILRSELLARLNFLMGVVERRNTMPILANVLLEVKNQKLKLTGTDLEVELVAEANLLIGENSPIQEGRLTIPARKLFDICRSLPEEAVLSLEADDKHRPVVVSGKSRFLLSSLPAEDFPSIHENKIKFTTTGIKIPQKFLLKLFKKTHFAMASQDVRYFLNGLLFDIKPGKIKVVATDGHRLALASDQFGKEIKEIKDKEPEALMGVASGINLQVILPRKAVIELMHLLQESDTMVSLSFGQNHFRAELEGYQFTSKLIDGRYPDYTRVIPNLSKNLIKVETESLRAGLSKAAILANEKFRRVVLKIFPNLIHIFANNPEQEKAEDEVFVDYAGKEIEIGFNVNYLLDALSTLGEKAEISLENENSSAMIKAAGDDSSLYVVMPIRL